VTRVLVVDDELALRRALQITLSARGYQVDSAADGRAALEQAARTIPDVVLLDLGLPDMDGMEVITALRGWTATPIVVLSARTDSTDKIDALDAGADDYVTKPFNMGELLARLRAALRHAGQDDEEPTVRLGDVEVDLAARRVRRGANDTLHLSPTEWRMLTLLLRNPGRLVTTRQVLAQVWGPGFDRETHYPRLYMARLRKKLEADASRPRFLLTEPGMGYRYEPGG
jgi:two-component system, OmpR family, KDP operon response regulator KdpE